MEDINDKSSSSSLKNITSSQNTLKTISLNFINTNNYNLNDAQIFENNKENSYYDKDLNEKIIKLFIGDHPLLPMKTIEKIAHCNFMNQHYKNKDFYNIKVIDEIIHNESSHIVAEFKDYLIKGDTSEFIMKFYKKRESLNLLPKISECYINCSVIFPNYVILPESKYIYKNIKKKQRVIDIQQEQEEREENIKNGVYEQEKEPTIFTTQAFDSILNQTDTSGVKKFFNISHEKSGDSSGVFKLMNNIETAEKKLGNNSKKNKINVCKLKKGNNEFQNNYKKNITLNDPGYNKKLQSAFNNRKGEGGIFNEKKISEKNNNINNINLEKNNDLNINKNNLKQLLRQSTENNNTNTNNNTNNFHHKKNNNFSTQVTYIDSCNHHMKNPFDLKGIETIKKIGKNSKNLKEIKNDNNDKEKEKEKLIGKNNSQTYSSIKEIERDNEKNINNYYIKGKNLLKENKNIFSTNKENSEINNFSINQSDIKTKTKEKEKLNTKKSRIKKENLSRNNNYPLYQFDTNIKTYCEDPMKISSKNKNMITSYKTKSQTKNKTKGYQTSRNKYDNKNMYINISKSNISKNHQSIDSDMNNNNRIKKNMNQIQNKHNNLKNNLINALLASQNNKQKKKITKYKDIIQKEKEKEQNQEKENNNKSSNGSIISIIDSNELKDIHNTSNNNNIDIINININNENNLEQELKDNNKGYILEKNDSNNKRIISNSNIDKESNNKISSTSCTKTMSINSYGSKPKNFYGNNNNKMNHKKQISMSKIPNSLPENKILNNKMTKKMNKINEELENKNKLKEFIDNYLDDYFSSNNNLNINNNYIDNHSKNKSKSRTKNEPLTVRNNIQEKRKEKDDNNKIRKSIFNFEKRISKKLSEKNLNIFDKFKNKSSPKDGKKNKTSTIKINKSGNMQNSDRCCPLSARESNLNYQINAEMIELLSNKIQKIKQSIKETSDKGSNSISSIFKKKKIPSANKKTSTLPLGIKKSVANDFIEKKGNNSKTRNKKNKNGLIGATSSNSNIGISGNLVNTIINSIYQTNLLSPNKKNIEYDKLMKTFHKFKRPTNSFSGNNNGNNNNNSKGKYNNNHNNVNNNKKDSKSKKKHGRYNSIYSSANNNYENNLNIEVNIKNNLKVQQKKQTSNNNNINNNKHINDNLNSLNINFNNYTNNYNYNYNINSASGNSNNINSNPINNNTNNANININSNNYSNSMVNKVKSSSQKIIMGKIVGKTDNNLKGIPINGFDKLITKKYNTRNYNIPLSVTERVKQANMYATSFATNNTNSNRYRNSNRAHMTINRIYQKK